MKRPKMFVYLIELTTRHFDFNAVGLTAEDAIRALRATLAKHCQQTGADPTYFEEVFPEPRKVEVGRGYRDGGVL